MKKLMLLTLESAMADALQTVFKNDPQVEVMQGTLENFHDFDTIISSSNGFGFMDTGFDEAIIHRLGRDAMVSVQREIQRLHKGVQPVGTALTVRTHHPEHPWLIHTPVVMTSETVQDARSVFFGFRAALLTIIHHNTINKAEPMARVLAPAMGGGAGRVPHLVCARMMRLAYTSTTHYPENPTWRDAQGLAQLLTDIGE